jgi:hypothetical protein
MGHAPRRETRQRAFQERSSLGAAAGSEQGPTEISLGLGDARGTRGDAFAQDEGLFGQPLGGGGVGSGQGHATENQ